MTQRRTPAERPLNERDAPPAADSRDRSVADEVAEPTTPSNDPAEPKPRVPDGYRPV